MRVPPGLALLGLLGCSPVDIDAISWRCAVQTDCGDGFGCRAGRCVRVDAGGQDGVSADEVRIGLIAPITNGPTAGVDLRAGLEAAFATVNAEGGVHGRRLTLDVHDDHYTVDRARALAVMLATDRSAIVVIGGVGDHVAPVIAEVLVDAEIAHLSLGRSAEVHPATPSESLFTFGPAHVDELTALIAQVATRDSDFDPANVALFTQAGAAGPDAHGQALTAALRLATQADSPVFSHVRGTADVDIAVRAIIDWLTTPRVTDDYTPAIVLGGEPAANAALVTSLLETFFGLRRGDIPRAEFGLDRAAAQRLEQVSDPVFLIPSGLGTTEVVDRLVDHPLIRAARGPDRVACANLIIAHPLPDPRRADSGAEALVAATKGPPTDMMFEGWVVGQAIIEALNATGSALDAARFADQFGQVTIDVGVPFDFATDDHVGIDAVLLSETTDACALMPIGLRSSP